MIQIINYNAKNLLVNGKHTLTQANLVELKYVL